jgi:hypothetical protein
MRPKIIKLLDANIAALVFLDLTQKVKATKVKIDKWVTSK